MGKFDNIDLGASATLRRTIQSAVRRRHDALRDAINLLKNRGFREAASVIEAMIAEEAEEIGQ